MSAGSTMDTQYPFAEGRRVLKSLGLAVGDGPIYAVGQGPDAVYSLYNGQRKSDGRSYQRVLWLANPAYRGPLVIRARQLDGDRVPRFREDLVGPLLTELVLPVEGRGSLPDAPGWRLWQAYTLLDSPGHYTYEIDGTGFRQTIEFQVVRERPNQLHPGLPFRRLPRELIVRSAVRQSPGHVRLALTGLQFLALRVDTSPTSAVPLNFAYPNVRRTETPSGPVLWQADEQWGWPTAAVWDDGRYRYHLALRDSAPGNWSVEDLVQLVAGFAAAHAR